MRHRPAQPLRQDSADEQGGASQRSFFPQQVFPLEEDGPIRTAAGEEMIFFRFRPRQWRHVNPGSV